VLSILLAATLLIGSIVNLYLVRDNPKRLGLVGVYTAVFAASVGILSNVRRAELFASTAAHAAVLVVFMSGNLAAP
jgi:ABC-type Mn2+/Zn2+ transport system permease subunit